MRVLVSGGAGFVGSSLATSFLEEAGNEVVVLDNLRRRGSELNLPRFKEQGIVFYHGDVRSAADLDDLPGDFDVFIEASAEPSVHAGRDGSPQYVLQTNLGGTLNCLEFARKRVGTLVFLSTSRVFSIEPLRGLRLVEGETRFELEEEQPYPGVSSSGIAEDFPTHLPRSLYGATKLCSEVIIQEYVDTYGMRAVINRCGVLAGPGQFGKVDQGVVTLWVAAHFYGKPLRYTGFGGAGKQVRDVLHPGDLYAVIQRQLARIEECSGRVFNIGGGRQVSTSLLELTTLCRRVTGREVPIAADPTTSPVDIPLYITDSRLAQQTFGWEPRVGVESLVQDIHRWLKANEAQLRPLMG